MQFAFFWEDKSSRQPFDDYVDEVLKRASPPRVVFFISPSRQASRLNRRKLIYRPISIRLLKTAPTVSVVKAPAAKRGGDGLTDVGIVL